MITLSKQLKEARKNKDVNCCAERKSGCVSIRDKLLTKGKGCFYISCTLVVLLLM